MAVALSQLLCLVVLAELSADTGKSFTVLEYCSHAGVHNEVDVHPVVQVHLIREDVVRYLGCLEIPTIAPVDNDIIQMLMF
jgi:hypothetical protein